MTLFKCIVSSIFFLHAQNIIAQEILIKYLKIDTVLFEKNYKKGSTDFIENFVRVNNSPLDDDYNYHYNAQPVSHNQQQFFIAIKYRKGDSISIITDDKESKVWFYHLERLPDTVHISKWTLFHNELQDSISTWVEYYNYIDDRMVNIYKVQKRKSATKKRDGKLRHKVELNINNSVYEIPLKIINEGGSVTSYHGYVGKNGEKKRRTKENAGKKQVKYKKFHGRRYQKNRVYIGLLDFQITNNDTQ